MSYAWRRASETSSEVQIETVRRDQGLARMKSWWLQRLAVPMGMVFLLVAKLYFVHSQFNGPLLARPLWLAVTLFVLSALLCSGLNFNVRWGNGFALVVNGLLSFLLWGDLLYYRLFADWPSLSSLAAAHQLGDAGQSIWGAARPGDLWLFIDLPFWCLILLRKWTCLRPTGLVHRLVPLALTLSLPLGGLSFLTISVARPELVPIRHDNAELVQYHGVLLYHGYDLVCYTSTFFSPLSAPELKDSLEVLRAARGSVGSEVPHFGAYQGANGRRSESSRAVDHPIYLCYNRHTCGSSSVGRASASQAEGREFESRLPLQSSPMSLRDPLRRESA